MPLPELLTAIDQLTSACKNVSIHDKADAFSKESVTRINASHLEMVLCILYHATMAAEAGYIMTMPMAVEALKAWEIHRQDEDQKPFQLADIIQGCRGLIIWGENDQSIRIRSPLFGDYLKRKVFGTDYDKRWVTASLRYLSSDNFANGAPRSSAALKERLRENTYLWFAAKLLSSTLAKAIPDTFVQDFRQLSSRRGSIESYQQAAEANPFESETSYNEFEEYCERWHCFTSGYSPLHLAAHLAAPAYLIDDLVASGEDVGARDRLGRTALHLAAEIQGDISVMRSLIEAGSDVSAKDDDTGDTPLANAVIYGDTSSVKFLLDNGADISELDEDILEQCGQENPDTAVCLRELGIDVPAPDESGAED